MYGGEEVRDDVVCCLCNMFCEWIEKEEKGTSSYQSRGVVLATTFWLPPPLLTEELLQR